jgi:hypothetical protein
VLFPDIVAEPCRDISRDALAEVLREELQGITCERLAELLCSRVDAAFDFVKLCRGKRAGTWMTLPFNPHRLDTGTACGAPVIAEFAKRDSFAGVSRFALTDKSLAESSVARFLVRNGINGCSIIQDFPPHIARDIFASYSARRILDPCAGWGGRMVGAAAVGAFYHGFEPSTRTHAGLTRLGEWLKRFNTGFDFRVDCVPFEDAELGGRYDLAFTSPPYFDTEHYADEPTQSCIRYPSLSTWLDKFYRPLIRKASAAADVLVLNVGDRKYDLVTPLIEEFGAVPLTRFSINAAGLGRDASKGERFFEIAATATPL